MIQLHHVGKTYAPALRALSDINLEIEKGELVFLAGASGAGKSTLLKLLFRQEEPSQGQIIIDGKNITRLPSRGVAAYRRTIGLVFQEFKLLPGLSALENVALAAEVIGVSKKDSRTKAFNLLRDLGLNQRLDAKPMTLSGGEQQRVAIDEPTGNLDREMANETMRLFGKIRERGATIIIATHDVELVNRYGTRVIYLQRGELVDDLCRVAAVRDEA